MNATVAFILGANAFVWLVVAYVLCVTNPMESDDYGRPYERGTLETGWYVLCALALSPVLTPLALVAGLTWVLGWPIRYFSRGRS